MTFLLHRGYVPLDLGAISDGQRKQFDQDVKRLEGHFHLTHLQRVKFDISKVFVLCYKGFLINSD